MSWNVTSVAPSGSGTVAHFDHAAVAPLDVAGDGVAVVDRGDGDAQRRPDRVVAGERMAPADHRLDMRALLQRRRIELPHLREHRIEQPQPAVAREHRDAFGQVVERLALHADQRLVAALELERLGDVVVEIDHAAFRIGRGDDAQRAAVGQVPFVLTGFGGPIGLVQLGLPFAEVLLLRQPAARRAAGRAPRKSLGPWSRKPTSRSQSERNAAL